jgi:hypothetical protein
VPVPEDVSHEWAAMQRADGVLNAAVEQVRARYRVTKDTAAIVAQIKKTMHVRLPSGLTVFQTLHAREQQKGFNDNSLGWRALSNFDEAMGEFLVARDGRAQSLRTLRRVAHNAWKEDAGAERRARDMELRIVQKGEPRRPFHSPFRGQPELYDPAVVIAFAIAVARAADRPRFSWTRDDNKRKGPMLDLLVASIGWVLCTARMVAGPVRSRPVRVTAEGLLRIIKAARRSSDN